MIHGGDKEFTLKYKLNNDGESANGDKYEYLRKSKCLHVKTIDDVKDFRLVCESMLQM